MEQADKVALTAAGYRQLQQELKRLKAVRLPEVTARLRQAREFAGDRGEDLEFRDATREREELDERIAGLEAKLAAASVLEPASVPPERAVLGCWVELEDLDTGERSRYQLVNSAEANPSVGRLSIESPVGRAVAGQTVRQMVEAVTPHGPRRLRIVDIEADS